MSGFILVLFVLLSWTAPNGLEYFLYSFLKANTNLLRSTTKQKPPTKIFGAKLLRLPKPEVPSNTTIREVDGRHWGNIFEFSAEDRLGFLTIQCCCAYGEKGNEWQNYGFLAVGQKQFVKIPNGAKHGSPQKNEILYKNSLK